MKKVLKNGHVKHEIVLERSDGGRIVAGSSLHNSIVVSIKQGRISRGIGMDIEEFRSFCEDSLKMLDDIEKQRLCARRCSSFSKEDSILCPICENTFEEYSTFQNIAVFKEEYGSDVSKWSDEIVELFSEDREYIQSVCDSIRPRY